MAYLGDFRLGDTLDFAFTTRQISGAPSTLSSSPVLSCYVGNSTTEITAGITLSVDFDSRTGMNHVRIVASGGNGYATASDYSVVITTGTVNSVSVVGEVVADFSIEHRSAVMPTTAALTLDVSAGGEAGVDWANVGGKTTSNALTGTSIIVTQKVDVDTIKTNPVANAGTVTFPTNKTLADATALAAVAAQLPAALTAGGLLKSDMLAINAVATTPVTTVKAVQGLAVDGVIPTATNLTNAPGAGDFTATMKTSIGTAVAASAVASVTARVTANADQIAGSTNAASNLARGTLGTTLGTCAGSSTTTAIIASSLDPASAVDSQWNGKIITFDRATTTAALRGQSTPITAYVHSTLTFTVTALTTAPVSGDTFTIS